MSMEIPQELKNFLAEHTLPRRLAHRPASTVQEILRESLLPYLPLKGIPVPWREMLEEAKRLESVALSHRSRLEEHKGWKSLVLHGISSVHTQHADQYGMDPEDPSIYRWTDIADLCPVTKAFFQTRFHYEEFQRVRFMYLEAGGYILPHVDEESRYYLGPTNIALNNPEGCRFVMENVGEVPFRAGDANKLALIHRHAVYNESSETRIHIIVHGSPDMAYWSEIFKKSYQSHIETLSRQGRLIEA